MVAYLSKNVGKYYSPSGSFDDDIALGVFQDISEVIVEGFNEAVGTGALEDISSTGTINHPTAAHPVRVAAGNVNDTAGGSGTTEVTITGLDGDGNQQTSVIATAGTSASLYTAESYMRINTDVQTGCGTYKGTNAADITIEQKTTGTVMATIPAGKGIGADGRYCTPNGHILLIDRILIQTDSSKPATVEVLIQDGYTVTAPFSGAHVVLEVESLSGAEPIEFHTPLILDEKQDIWARGIADSGGASKVVFAFEGRLYRKPAASPPA